MHPEGRLAQTVPQDKHLSEKVGTKEKVPDQRLGVNSAKICSLAQVLLHDRSFLSLPLSLASSELGFHFCSFWLKVPHLLLRVA